MENINTDKETYGAAALMSPELRELVEKQLLAEFPHYKLNKTNLQFDWSGSANEGHQMQHPLGIIASFSGILVLDENKQIVADGWMEFILEPDFFLAYWDYITIREGKKKLSEKQMPGIPKHVWKQIPIELREKYSAKRLKG
ncbi:hypothetical protein I5M27_18350 [Adhaeribacter sp. BT258]|uniref:Uncharacterized protein n=1 Tax=Adhaeribacter terrigena TaxID=2793070 RepID=A0ABS1C8F7_9BACT|nr:hypothetical protein [Adhaeribacter terrigena]MBK0404958.1 hypothetical protein [Adhaeribacter terrigena]